jgi:hypothetical protein
MKPSIDSMKTLQQWVALPIIAESAVTKVVAAALESAQTRGDGANGESKESQRSQDLPMLSPKASAVYELLLTRPEHRSMTGPQIVEALPDDAAMDESTLRKSIVPALRPYGLEHRAKIGYRIKPSRRPPPKISD